MSKKNEKKTIFVAMSGGVDSSVAAALMKKQGYNVTGVFMRPWQPISQGRTLDELNDSTLDYCLWRQDREDALRVAAKLDIPLLTWDFSKEYRKYVADYMIRGYQRGITPNPDVMCNKFIKFGVFLDKALELGADYIATGHYVRKVNNKLFKARDLNKDQSYFLYTLTQKQLKYCLFPIGNWNKNEVRQMAKKSGLSNWAKPDSQGVCFVGSLKVSEFLKKWIEPLKGSVLRKSDEKILGEHDGAWLYTIGQRHGLNLSAGKPYYVVDKDFKNNVLYVEERLEIKNQELGIMDFNWINQKEKLPLDCKVKTRYRQKDLNCAIVKNDFDKALVKIKENNTPVAPGQSAVFYKGNELLGGGIIL
ncbi:MAG: tRNA 2-thiouridine(34) synthase MnmA [Patescibacteria group bacterium]